MTMQAQLSMHSWRYNVDVRNLVLIQVLFQSISIAYFVLALSRLGMKLHK